MGFWPAIADVAVQTTLVQGGASALAGELQLEISGANPLPTATFMLATERASAKTGTAAPERKVRVFDMPIIVASGLSWSTLASQFS